MSEFQYQDPLPLGHDDAPYRLLTQDHVSTFEAGGATFLRVEPEALTLLTREAMRDLAHLLRPAHLAQLRAILDAIDRGELDAAPAVRARLDGAATTLETVTAADPAE